MNLDTGIERRGYLLLQGASILGSGLLRPGWLEIDQVGEYPFEFVEEERPSGLDGNSMWRLSAS
jgi:hypothetical protein